MADFPVVDGVTVLLPPPEGYEVDFDNPQSHFKTEHYVIFGLMGPVAFFCLLQRLYSKHFLAAGLQLDDLLITLSWMASVTMQSLHVWSISMGGLCHHVWEMSIETYETQSFASYIVAAVFIICNGLAKTALLTFYLQISSHPRFKITIYAAIGVVTTYVTVLACLLLFGCRPISASWNPVEAVTATCVNQPVLYMCIAVANIVSDIILFVIPIPTIIGLKMPRAQKIGAAIMFGIGSITVATSIIRMVYLPALLSSTDTPWDSAQANVWSFVECNLFIICGSMPTFRKFLRRFAPRLMGTDGSRTGQYKYGDSTAGSAYGTIQSRLRRQTRRDYAQFEGLEMGHFDRVDGGGGDVVQGTAVHVSSPVRGKSRSPNLSSSRDAGSDDGILASGKVIECTRTFDVQYSK